MSNHDDDDITLTVLRTSDAVRTEIHASMSMTLNELKDKEEMLSFLSSNNPYRFFHLGRELNNGGRTLQQLGVGRFHNYILHVHGSDSARKAPPKNRSKKRKQQPLAPVRMTHTSTTTAAESCVIELLDSDNEDDAVECIGTSSSLLTASSSTNNKRRRT